MLPTSFDQTSRRQGGGSTKWLYQNLGSLLPFRDQLQGQGARLFIQDILRAFRFSRTKVHSEIRTRSPDELSDAAFRIVAVRISEEERVGCGIFGHFSKHR